MQSALAQNEKMSAIGQLSAGVAHEINNPIAFVSSNLDILQDYVANIHGYLEAIDQLLATQDLILREEQQSAGRFQDWLYYARYSHLGSRVKGRGQSSYTNY